MKNSIFAIIFSLAACTAHAQMITPFVVASAGDHFVNVSANAMLSFTVGEMAMVQTFYANNHFLTQGFHQPDYTEQVAIQNPNFIEEFVIYPNPASDYVNIRYQMRFPGSLQIRMFGLNGVTVMPTFSTEYSEGMEIQEFFLEQVSQGLYFLEVTFRSPIYGVDHTSFHKLNIIKY